MRAKENPCGTVLVWRSLVFVFVYRPFLVQFFSFWDRLLTLTSIFAGNNYSISNESRTKNARIFFAQGCEMVPEMVSQSAAE
jgi:hypothetical protein